MENFIIEYWLEVLFSFIILGLGYLIKKINKQFCDQENIKGGTKALLRSQILSTYDKYMEREWIPVYALETALEMYQKYHDLGGNGAITKLIEELEGLSSKDPNK